MSWLAYYKAFWKCLSLMKFMPYLKYTSLVYDISSSINTYYRHKIVNVLILLIILFITIENDLLSIVVMIGNQYCSIER
jgi:hypothetical protein